MLAAGAVAGALLMLGPAWLKLRFGVDEVVTTLLLNFVALLFVSMMLEGPDEDPMSLGWPQSAPIIAAAHAAEAGGQDRVHAGLRLALAAAVVVWFLVQRTTWGLRSGRRAQRRGRARFAGMPGRVGCCCASPPSRAPWPGSPASARWPASRAT